MEAVFALDTLSSLFGSGSAAVTTPRPQGSSSCAVAVGGGSAAGPSTSSGQVIQLSDADLRAAEAVDGEDVGWPEGDGPGGVAEGE